MALHLPPTYLLHTHIPLDTLHELEEQIPNLTYDITEAKLVLGKVTTKQRAQFELRAHKLWTTEVIPKRAAPLTVDPGHAIGEHARARKKRRMDKSSAQDAIVIDSSTESEADHNLRNRHTGRKPKSDSQSQKLTQSQDRGHSSQGALSTPSPELVPDHNLRRRPTAKRGAEDTRSEKLTQSQDQSQAPAIFSSPPPEPESQASNVTSLASQTGFEWGKTVKVVKLAWFTESLAVGHLLPLGGYLVYEGKQVQKPDTVSDEPKLPKIVRKRADAAEILARAKADAPKTISTPFTKGGYHKVDKHSQSSQSSVTRPTFLHETTSEHDDPASLPPLPEWLHTTFSCQRPTPLHSPNDPFIDLLKKIRTARVLNADEIGVRAYSTAIASLAAYPYTITSIHEVTRLPGCEHKVSQLYQEWKETGHLSAVDEINSDPRLQVLNLFYEIWGVGDVTARAFYNKGWRDLDDIVEHGWNTLSRVQQIGLKYYDEFQIKIPRAEVDQIGDIVLKAANKVRPGCQMVIVGGYRRGKEESGDVDMIVSHPDETATSGLVQDIVSELENEGWITHTLLLSMANSERGQHPVSWKGDMAKRGSGFDTLDKALVVWQDPSWPTEEEDLAKNPKAKNPNIHRRVDIIISPWKTVGCAVMGWSAGTTFQRDVRRYAKNVKGLKFDSSGIRDRADGQWVDFETRDGKSPTDMVEAEKRVFEGLGLVYREPWERCTG